MKNAQCTSTVSSDAIWKHLDTVPQGKQVEARQTAVRLFQPAVLAPPRRATPPGADGAPPPATC